MMKLMTFGLAAVAIAIPARAEIDTFHPTQDSTITTNGFLGGGNANQGSNSILFSIPSSGYTSYAVFKFDVSSMAGLTVTGTPTLSLYLSGINGSSSQARTFNVDPLTGSWTESGITWNNAPALGASVASTSFSSIAIGSTININLSAALLQSWIDSPSTNYGFALAEATAQLPDLQFASRETSHQPTLTVTATTTATPEPMSFVLAMTAFALLALCRQRRVLSR